MRFFRRHTPRQSEATTARIRAERDLEQIKAQTHVYRELGQRMRQIRERNHLAELFEHAMKGKP